MKQSPIQVSLRISASIDRVFSAWIEPSTAGKWQCDRLEGKWESGTVLAWHFGDFRQTLNVLAVHEDSLLEFTWRAHNQELETRVQIRFSSIGPSETGIVVQETGWGVSAETLSQIVDHACGWENMLCRLKVWLELGAGFSVGRGSFSR